MSAAFRRALGRFPTGVTVIATREPDGTPRGFTANSFTSVSLEPALVLVCVAARAASRAVFEGAPGFSVSVLAEDQRETSGLFATQRPDKFELTPWRIGKGGQPLIDGALAWFECAREKVVEAGDHIVLIGRVTDFGEREGRPLGYLSGSYFTLGSETPLVDAAGRRGGAVIGAVWECDRSVLLEVGQDGSLAVPAIGREGTQASLARLTARYASPGFTSSTDFVYAVFEDRPTGALTVYYRGRASGPPPPGTDYVPFGKIDLKRIVDPPARMMLERYVDEATRGAFAIYAGDETAGAVRRVE